MEFKDYIQLGIDKSKSLTELSEKLGVHQPTLSGAKKHEKGLSEEVIFKLAEIIKTDPALIIAARERALAKTDDKREFWERYLKKRNALGIVIAIAICTGSTTPYPDNPRNSKEPKLNSMCTFCIM